MECGSVCRGPKKCPIAHGVRVGGSETVFSPFCLTPRARQHFLGPQQTECFSVCWDPIKRRFAGGVREGWQILDRVHRGLATS